ncbi:hypothetical protein EZS27_033273, partial [termite gut metagenome]
NAEVAEFTVKEEAKATKRLVKDLGLPLETNIGGRDKKDVIRKEVF